MLGLVVRMCLFVCLFDFIIPDFCNRQLTAQIGWFSQLVKNASSLLCYEMEEISLLTYCNYFIFSNFIITSPPLSTTVILPTRIHVFRVYMRVGRGGGRRLLKFCPSCARALYACVRIMQIKEKQANNTVILVYILGLRLLLLEVGRVWKVTQTWYDHSSHYCILPTSTFMTIPMLTLCHKKWQPILQTDNFEYP